MIYGYCRISTPSQSIDRQKRNILTDHPTAHLMSEAYTGTSIDRPEWQKLMAAVKRGDTIVFDSVSRMSRDADEGYRVYEELYQKGVALVFLKERHIDTAIFRKALENAVPMTGTMVDLILSGVNAYLMELAKEQIRLAFDQAQKEVDDLQQRTREGMVTAKLNGKQIGQRAGAKLHVKKADAAKKKIYELSKAFCGTLDDTDCMKVCEVSRNSFYKYKRELAEELGNNA